MHLLLHLFTARGKGAWVLPITILSYIIVFGTYWLISSQLKFEHNRFTKNILAGLSVILAGAIISITTRNYMLDTNGEKRIFEKEGEFMHVKVSMWAKILPILGFIWIITAIRDILFPNSFSI